MIIIPSKFFKKEFDHLFKKYKNITKDVEVMIEELKKGFFNGDNLGNNCYKIRLQNSDVNKWKSWGYRVIIYVIKNDKIYLLAIYSKTERASISNQEIKERLKYINNC